MKAGPVTPKKKYETPLIVDLGEVMRGYGSCSSGGSPAVGDGNCRNGGLVQGSQCLQGNGKL